MHITQKLLFILNEKLYEHAKSLHIYPTTLFLFSFFTSHRLFFSFISMQKRINCRRQTDEPQKAHTRVLNLWNLKWEYVLCWNRKLFYLKRTNEKAFMSTSCAVLCFTFHLAEIKMRKEKICGKANFVPSTILSIMLR